jgi:type IV secretory pathway component VirB8
MRGFGKKNASNDALPNTVEAAGEGSKGYPENFSVASLRERRLLMALRIFGVCLLGSLTLNVTQTYLLVSLMPLKEIRPFLVQVVDEGSVAASIKPIQDTFEAKDILTEKLVRDYVINRHEILRSEPVMASRWRGEGIVGTMTDPREYRRFRDSVTEVYDQIRSNNAARRATILSVSTVTAGKIYIVDFRSTSYDENDQEIANQVYTATLEVDFRRLDELSREQMLINPTGFTVVNYSLARKDQ